MFRIRNIFSASRDEAALGDSETRSRRRETRGAVLWNPVHLASFDALTRAGFGLH
jgi:hypothetical protein